VTKDTQIGFTWLDGAQDGGTPVLDYKISYADNGGEYTTLEIGVTAKTYTVINMLSGHTYGFKVQARNNFGYSDFSQEVLITAAKVPAKPAPPTTTFQRETVLIDWVAPDAGGSPIKGYRIFVRQNDGVTFTLELDNCDGTTSQTIISDTQCTIKVSTLRDAPFNLPWGAGVFVKVLAFNSYGDSELSDAGNGAVIITYADAPVSLIETASARSATSITFSWTAGATNGGSTVSGYRVNSDGALGVWSVIADDIVGTSYTATGLIAGLKYTFRVEAENGFGYSEYSS